ncbi:fatty acid desaturase [Bremerella sp. JC770]|uniref:fatty acid desaturase family protein n=1 Tax=Bremerella sp. JC770 TaxID=3232137 RepID=UPI00345B13B6
MSDTSDKSLQAPLHCNKSADFSMAEARKSIGDLFKPKPWVYWTDFLVSFSVGMICFRMVRQSELFSWQQALFFVISSALFYRLAMFIHELVHLRTGTFTAFRVMWNLLVGIPFLMPSFVYYTHLDHHRRKHYGTDMDGEYLPIEHEGRWQIFAFLASSFVVPFLAVFRFLILTPLTWISPRFRDWAFQHASSMVIDPKYIRPLPTKTAMRLIRLQEGLCFLWCLGVLIGALTVGGYPYPFLVQGYCTGVFVLTLNALRTLVAHRWHNHEGEMTFLEQLLDSVNFPSNKWVTQIWAPIGTRFHALHHMFPSLPYHAMPEAHRRLIEQLPEGSPYHQTNETSFTHAFLDLWNRCGRLLNRKSEPAQQAEAAPVEPATSHNEMAKSA